MPTHLPGCCSMRWDQATNTQRRRGRDKALRSFNDGRANLSRAKSRGLAALLAATDQALAKNTAARRRAEAGQRRFDTREWVVERRTRTRHLIELGGLVQKSGLVELADDDRATLYGAMLDLVGRAGDGDGANALALWKRRGKRAFDAEAEAADSADSADTTAKEV